MKSASKRVIPITPEAAIPAAILEQVTLIPTDQLSLGPLNPRRRVNIVQQTELAANIRQNGIVVPLVAMEVEGGGYQILAGGRRWRVASELGLSPLPVIVREYTEQQAREFAAFENLLRADVHPMEEALGYRDLMASAGYDVKTLAARVGKKEEYIYRRFVLCNLTETAQEMFLKGEIGLGQAYCIARLLPADQQKVLDDNYHTGDAFSQPSISAIERYIERKILVVLSQAPFKTTDAKLLPEAGSCTDCPKRTGANAMLWAEEVDKDDCCTDPSCFARKVQATIDRSRVKLGKSKRMTVDITNDWKQQEAPGSPLAASQYTVVTAEQACSSTKNGLIVEGGSRGSIGAALLICDNPECEMHHAKPRKAVGIISDEHAKQNAAEQDTKFRSRVLAGCVAHYPKGGGYAMPVDDLQLLCRTHLKRVTADEHRHLWKIMGWTIPKGHMGRPDSHQFETHVSLWNTADLFRFLLAVTLVPEAKVASYSGGVGKHTGILFDMAGKLKVPVEAIKKYTADEVKARLKKGKARTEALAALKQPDSLAAKAGYYHMTEDPEPAFVSCAYGGDGSKPGAKKQSTKAKGKK